MAKTATGWEFKDAEETVETYAAGGRLLGVRSRSGYQLKPAYDGDGLVASVTDSFGRQLAFAYSAGQLATMTDPDGGVYRYLYDQTNPYTRGRLSQVVYPDDTPGNDMDNPRVTYLYDDPEFLFALTGVIDENGERFATWTYDDSLRPTMSEHAGGVERTTVTYDDPGFSRTTTNALGKQTAFHFAEIERKWKVTQVEGHASANCVAANRNYTYNSRGFVASATDWNGNLTTYQKENSSRDLPLTRTEAGGTPEQRVTTYSWHANYRLPTRIVEPGRTIDLTYDADGRLVTRTETDTTSHSVPYSTAGHTRTWTYGYEEVGPPAVTPPAPVPLVMVNPGAELGNLTGWTTEAGAFISQSSIQAYEGSRRFKADSGTDAVIYQDVPVPAGALADVDDATMAAEVSWQHKNAGADNDPGGVVLAFLDALGATIGAASESEPFSWPNSDWQARVHYANVPPGTRSIRVKLKAERLTGTTFDAYFDAVQLRLIPSPSLPPGPMPLLASIDGPRTDVSDVTTFEYTVSGQLAKVTDALGHETEVTAHDGAGRPLKVMDENGIETTLAYTPRGWLASVTVDSGAGGAPATTAFTYDDVGQITRVALPGGAALNHAYDAAHRPTAVSNDQGERIEYTLDAMGNRTGEVIKAVGGITKRTRARAFDELGRLLRTIGAASQTFGYSYDPNGNVTSETDGLGRIWAHAFDGLDRLVQEVDPISGQADYGYDGQDALTDVTDPNGQTTIYVRDGFGRVIQEDSPDRGVTVYVYDPAGNLVEETDARGVVTEYAHDALNRLVAKTYPASPAEDVSYDYDDTTGGNFGVGRLTSVVDASGTSDFVYDARGNLIEETRSQGSAVYTTSYAYDLADRLVAVVYPSGRSVSYERDALGRVREIETQDDAAAPVVTLADDFSYLPFGPLATLDFGNGLGLSLSYDQDYRLTAIETDGANAVQDLALGYDANDRVTTIADGLDPSKSQDFAYDELGRLEQAEGAYGTIDYGYDAGGNRLARTLTDGGTTTETYSYDAFSNRLLSVSDGAATRSFGYAADGSVTSDDRGADAFDLTYDAAGRLVEVEKNAAPLATYAYDAFGRRVQKDPVVGTTTHYQYHPDGRLLAESTATGAPEREYIWLPLDGQPWALPLALVTDAGTASPRLHYLHVDHLDTPVAMTSAGFGQVEWSATYRPFGEVHAITGTETLALRFPGQFLDSETGFHQNWHRDYDPRLARYLQPDPIGLEGGLTPYAYVGGDPANLIDPEGLQEALVRSLPLASSAAVLDGPLPYGDAVALGLIGGALVYDACAIAWDRFLSDDSTVTDKIGKIAKDTGLSPEQVRRAIHRAKENMPRNTDVRNPDVAVDTATGEIYHKNSDGSLGDSIGNIFDD